MATTSSTRTPPTPAQPAGPPGPFISQAILGYVEPPDEVIRQIEGTILLTQPSQEVLRALLTIKLLAPVESRMLRVFTIPQAEGFILSLKAQLVGEYHRRMSVGG